MTDDDDVGGRAEVARRRGATIRAVRVGRGMSQTDLAVQVEVSKSYLSHIEAGRREIPGELLQKIADALDVQVFALDDGAEAGHTWLIGVRLRPSTAVVGEPHRDAEGFEMLQIVEVRAWNLRDALRQAAELPLDRWFEED